MTLFIIFYGRFSFYADELLAWNHKAFRRTGGRCMICCFPLLLVVYALRQTPGRTPNMCSIIEWVPGKCTHRATCIEQRSVCDDKWQCQLHKGICWFVVGSHTVYRIPLYVRCAFVAPPILWINFTLASTHTATFIQISIQFIWS